MILFPWSHSSTPNPHYQFHLEGGRALAAGIKQVKDSTYTVGPVGVVLCKFCFILCMNTCTADVAGSLFQGCTGCAFDAWYRPTNMQDWCLLTDATWLILIQGINPHRVTTPSSRYLWLSNSPTRIVARRPSFSACGGWWDEWGNTATSHHLPKGQVTWLLYHYGACKVIIPEGRITL